MAGRPRRARAHHSVLDATVALFAERGIDGTSMDAIARASGVSKATIYKHWPNKDALALEMLDHLHRLDDWPETQSRDVVADITALLARRPSPRTAALRARIMPHLMAYAARHEGFHKAWRARLLEPTRERLTRLLHRAIAEGRLPLGFDCDVASRCSLARCSISGCPPWSACRSPRICPRASSTALARARCGGACVAITAATWGGGASRHRRRRA